jgi:gluconate kinase
MQNDDLSKRIAEAREMQLDGKYINGEIFHSLANEIDRLNGVINRLRDPDRVQRLRGLSNRLPQTWDMAAIVDEAADALDSA